MLNVYRVRGVFDNWIRKYHLEPVVNSKVITNKSLATKAAQGDWDDWLSAIENTTYFNPNESAESRATRENTFHINCCHCLKITVINKGLQDFLLLINFIIKKQAIFSINTYCLPINTIFFLIFSKKKSCDKENELSWVTLCGLQCLSLTKEEETDRAELLTKHYSHSKCLSFPCFVLNLSVTIF